MLISKEENVRTFATHKEWTVKETSIFATTHDQKHQEVGSEGTKETTINVVIKAKNSGHRRTSAQTERSTKNHNIFEATARQSEASAIVKGRSSNKAIGPRKSSRESSLVIQPVEYRTYWEYFTKVKHLDGNSESSIPKKVYSIAPAKVGDRHRPSKSLNNSGEKLESDQHPRAQGAVQMNQSARVSRRNSRMKFDSASIRDIAGKQGELLNIPEVDNDISVIQLQGDTSSRSQMTKRLVQANTITFRNFDTARSNHAILENFGTAKIEDLFLKRPDAPVPERLLLDTALPLHLDASAQNAPLQKRYKRRPDLLHSLGTPDPYLEFIKKKSNSQREKQLQVQQKSRRDVKPKEKKFEKVLNFALTGVPAKAESRGKSSEKNKSNEIKDSGPHAIEGEAFEKKGTLRDSDLLNMSINKKGHTVISQSNKGDSSSPISPRKTLVRLDEVVVEGHDVQKDPSHQLKIPSLSDLNVNVSQNQREKEGPNSSKSNGADKVKIKSFALAAGKLLEKVMQGMDSNRRASLQPSKQIKTKIGKNATRFSTRPVPISQVVDPQANRESLKSVEKHQLRVKKTGTENEPRVRLTESFLNESPKLLPANKFMPDVFLRKETDSRASDIAEDFRQDLNISPIRFESPQRYGLNTNFAMIKFVRGFDFLLKFIHKTNTKYQKAFLYLLRFAEDGKIKRENSIAKIDQAMSMFDIFQPIYEEEFLNMFDSKYFRLTLEIIFSA